VLYWLSGGGIATAGLLMGYLTPAIEIGLLIGFATLMIWGIAFNFRTSY